MCARRPQPKMPPTAIVVQYAGDLCRRARSNVYGDGRFASHEDVHRAARSMLDAMMAVFGLKPRLAVSRSWYVTAAIVANSE